MQSEPRCINSVSDLLYSTDEIEFLLEDIKALEPKSYKPEEIQDWEIAGSRTGALGDGSAGGAEWPGGCECESPLGTVNSWDSHCHYRRRRHSPDPPLYDGVILYCDRRQLATPSGLVRLLLLATTIASLSCLCTSGTVKVGLFMLPMAGRIRLMMFTLLFTMFVTSVILFLDISHIIYLFPFNWGKVNAYLYLSLSVLFLVASSLIFHLIFASEAFSWVPKWTHQQLLVTGILGYVCCAQCAVLAVIQQCRIRHYQPVAEDPSLNLQERQLLQQQAVAAGAGAAAAGTAGGSPLSSPARQRPPANQIAAHNYTSYASYPATATTVAVASTSRQDAVAAYLEDGQQPCSSKSAGAPYRAA